MNENNRAHFAYEIDTPEDLSPSTQHTLTLVIKDVVNNAVVTKKVLFRILVSPKIDEAKLQYHHNCYLFGALHNKRTIMAVLSLKNGVYPVSELYYDITNCKHRGFYGHFLLDMLYFSQEPGASSYHSYIIYSGKGMTHKQYMRKLGCSTGTNPALGEFWVVDNHGNSSDHVRVYMTRG